MIVHFGLRDSRRGNVYKCDLVQAEASTRRIVTWMGNHVVGGEAECARAIPIAC